MNGVSIGPLAFDGQRLAAVAAIIAFLVAVEVIARWRRNVGAAGDPASWATVALFAWIIGARIGFVAANWSEFAARPLEMLKLWQGGFSALWGWTAGAGVLLAALLRDRRRVVVPLAMGAVAAVLAQQIIVAGQPQTTATLPAMQLTRLDGGPVDLADRGRPVVLNLWATWCPPCRREMPMMIDMAARAPHVDFVFANQGEDAARILAFLADEKLLSADIVRDPAQKLMSRLGAVGLPSTMVFDARGQLVAARLGEISRATLSEMIERAGAN